MESQGSSGVAFDPLELGWLTPASADFRERVRALQIASPRCGVLLHQLASQRVDSAQTGLFNRTLTRLRAGGADLAPLVPFRLSILSNATVDLIADALPIAAARHRVALDINVAPFDQVFQQAIDPNSELHRSPSDAILLILDHRWLGLTTPNPGSGDRVSNALNRLTELLEALQSISTRR